MKASKKLTSIDLMGPDKTLTTMSMHVTSMLAANVRWNYTIQDGDGIVIGMDPARV